MISIVLNHMSSPLPPSVSLSDVMSALYTSVVFVSLCSSLSFPTCAISNWSLKKTSDLGFCVSSNGCMTSEDMLWKLDALQSFIHDLHWPDEVFAEHLNQRLKIMSREMIEAASKRSLLTY